MTAPSLALQGLPSPGKVSKRMVVALASRTPTIAVFKFSSGTSNYTTGGEDISDIWTTFFRNVLSVTVSQNSATVANRRKFLVDMTNKKLIIFSAVNTQNTATDLSAVTDDVRLTVVGYR